MKVIEHDALQQVMGELHAIYSELDHLTRALADTHARRLQCRRGCTRCCVDDLTVFQVEGENIRHLHGELLETAAPHEPGACAFLDRDGSCRIYESRPYVCRTQGLPLRWIDELEDGEMVEMRDICPQNDTPPPIETLPVEHCWTLGPFEEKLASLQVKLGGWDLHRVPLRELFRNPGGYRDKE